MKTIFRAGNRVASTASTRTGAVAHISKRLGRVALPVVAVALALPAMAGTVSTSPADASVTFDFNVVSSTAPNAATGMKLATLPNIGSGLGATASSSAISTYMTAALHAAGFSNSAVTANGAIGTATYAGEGYVWGNSLGNSDGATFTPTAVRPKTPATSTNPTDGFLINNNFGLYGGKTYSAFTLSFANFVIDTISYDWEIFPDKTCPTVSTCTALPDMTLTADGKSIAGGTQSAVTFKGASSNYAPQAMGTVSNLALGGASFLSFNDWPAEIGIDNLVITGHTVPEPATLPMLIGGLLGLTWLARRRKAGN